MAAAAEAHDGIILGAGHQGLVLACYLARAGLDVLLVERRLQYGGGCMTEEATLPGFYHNLHSINHFAVTEAPWYSDLGLADRVGYITVPTEFAQPHRDGTGLILSRDLEATLASIRRLAPRDADAFRELNALSERWTRDVLLPERFSEPLPQAEREAALGASALGRQFLDLTRRQPIDIIRERFADERVRVLLLFKLSIFGTILYEAVTGPSPTGTFVRACDLTVGYQICRGGSWNLARGLMEVFLTSGGHYRNQAEAARILVEGGRATGVEMSDGRTVRARSFVASTLDPTQTLEDMVGLDRLPDPYRQRLARFHYTPWGLFGVHLALREPPRYPAASYEPAIDRAHKYQVGSECLDDLTVQHEAIEQGRVPEDPQIGCGALTLFDPSQAPRGFHTAYAWQPVPWTGEDSEAGRREYMERIIAKWRRYAPNLTDDNILARSAYTPWDYSRALINMRRGDIFMGALSADQSLYNHLGYRTPVPGLYLAGSCVHPGGAISGGAGYIAAGVIARDLGIVPWWRPVDPRAGYERLGA